jgi:hypothetical protein
MTGRLMPQARYASELSVEEVACLAAMDDEHKLTVAHAMRLAILDVRRRDLALLQDLLTAWDTDQFEHFEAAFERVRRALADFDRWLASAPSVERP